MSGQARVHFTPDSGNSWHPAGGYAAGFSNAAVITPSATPLTTPAQALFVVCTAAGNLVIDTVGGQSSVSIALPAGFSGIIPLQITQYVNTSTGTISHPAE